jgi:RND family efflux transporter MFP subunit
MDDASGMSLRLQIFVTALLAAALAAGWMWYERREEPAAPSAAAAASPGLGTLVLVETLDLAEDRVTLRVVGTGKALRSASIFPEVAGQVVEVLFDGEQRVKKGEPLVRLEDEDERLSVRLAEVAAKEARREVERLEKLAPSGAVSVVRLENAQTAFESANLRLSLARAELADRTVVAPFDGVIGLPEIDQGDRVTADTLIATMDDRSAILVEFTVPEEFAGRIEIGSSIIVRAWTNPDQELHGTVTAAHSRISQATRSLRVQARIPNPGEVIRPGTSFDVRLTFVGKPYPSVREVAVLWSRDGAYVWRVSDGRAEKVFVKMVRRNEGRVLLDGPLAAGDRIVVEGVQGLREGQAVDPKPFGEAAPAEAGQASQDGTT